MASTPKKSTPKKTATKQSSTKADKPKKKMGRPRKEIDKAQFEALCGIQCTLEEVCAVLDVQDDTLNRWCKETYDGKTFSEVFKQKREIGKVSLRRAGFKLAQKSAPVHIFYAKNYLGMTDHVEIVDNTPIERLDAILGGLKDIAVAQAGANNEVTTESETE